MAIALTLVGTLAGIAAGVVGLLAGHQPVEVVIAGYICGWTAMLGLLFYQLMTGPAEPLDLDRRA